VISRLSEIRREDKGKKKLSSAASLKDKSRRRSHDLVFGREHGISRNCPEVVNLVIEVGKASG